jgi:predicted DNA-binding transcriptional regulator YafY
MPLINGKKALLLCVLEILQRYSDENHPLTARAIIEKLDCDYGTAAERKAISRNISVLREFGYAIRSCEKKKGYYLVDRDFDDTELRLLIDGVMTSRYIPHKDAARLIEKLQRMGSVHFAGRMKHVHSLMGWHHQRNKEFFFALAALDEAITARKQVAFMYNKCGTDGELHPEWPERKNVNPHKIICANGQYYLLGNYPGCDEIRHFRVDRITKFEMLDEEARPRPELPDLDIAQYAAEHCFMYGGKPRQIVFRMPVFCASDVVDAFGHSAKMRDTGDGYMEVCLCGAVEGMRYFALQFGLNCEVLSPPDLRETVKRDVAQIAQKYGLTVVEKDA